MEVWIYPYLGEILTLMNTDRELLFYRINPSIYFISYATLKNLQK